MISEKRNTIFIHIPKTGGQSIEKMFLKDRGLTWKDKVKAGLRDPSLRKPQIASHYTLCDYALYHNVSPMYSFCFVRNIYRRLQSMYKYLRKFKFIKGSFRDFILNRLPEMLNDPDWYYFVRPQADFLTGVKDVFEFSEFNKGIHTIRKKTGIKAELPHANKSSSKLNTTYTPDMLEKVEELYTVDFNKLPESCTERII